MASAAPIPSITISSDIPSLGQIRSVTLQKFGVRPCLWQVKVAQVLLKGDHDVLCTAGTGMGKTLGFWIPLPLFCQGIQIVITPLNMLGKQNAASLGKAGIRAISISSETATTANFAVSLISKH
jgi:superfamily II DNA helicase RecQ